MTSMISVLISNTSIIATDNNNLCNLNSTDKDTEVIAKI